MAKKPKLEHDYNHKKDRFEITLKRFALKKKKVRASLIENRLGALDKKLVHRRGGIKGGRRLAEVGD